MQDGTDVVFIHPNTKCRSRHHDIQPIVTPSVDKTFSFLHWRRTMEQSTAPITTLAQILVPEFGLFHFGGVEDHRRRQASNCVFHLCKMILVAGSLADIPHWFRTQKTAVHFNH